MTSMNGVYRKVYRQPRPDSALRVPFKEVQLSGGEPPVHLYDTSGPHSDPALTISAAQGLPRLRESWIDGRGDTELGERCLTVGSTNGSNGRR